MRRCVVSALIIGAALAGGIQSAQAGRYDRGAPRDCKPYNGPFGFYGNIWCQPSEASYLRNLGSQWPQRTPKSLRYPKPSSNYEW